MQIKQHDKSHIVELSDGSAWRIWPGDISMTLQWLPTTELDIAGIEDEVCSHALVRWITGARERGLARRCGPAGAPRGLKDMQSTHLRQQTPHTPRPGPGAGS
jgi:hypothetical protein